MVHQFQELPRCANSSPYPEWKHGKRVSHQRGKANQSNMIAGKMRIPKYFGGCLAALNNTLTRSSYLLQANDLGYKCTIIAPSCASSRASSSLRYRRHYWTGKCQRDSNSWIGRLATRWKLHESLVPEGVPISILMYHHFYALHLQAGDISSDAFYSGWTSKFCVFLIFNILHRFSPQARNSKYLCAPNVRKVDSHVFLTVGVTGIELLAPIPLLISDHLCSTSYYLPAARSSPYAWNTSCPRIRYSSFNNKVK